MLGGVLLIIVIIWPMYIAWWLIRLAMNGRLRVKPADNLSVGRFSRHLTFRYADYAVNLAEFQQYKDKHVWRRALQEPGEVLHWARMCAVLAWDSVLDLQRFVLAVLGLCVMLHEMHQLLLVTMVLGSYLIMIVLVRPWSSDAVWRLQVAASSVLVLSCCGILACNVGDISGHYSPQDAQRYMVAIPWVVMALNIAYIAGGVIVLGVCVKRTMNHSKSLPCCYKMCRSVAAWVRELLWVPQTGPLQA